MFSNKIQENIENKLKQSNDQKDIVEYDSKTVQRLSKAWICVLDQFKDMCVEKSLELGAGLNFFKFLPDTESTPDVNCENAYVPKESYIFEYMVDNEPSKDAIISMYNPSTMYLVSVHVPVTNSPLTTVGTIRGFEYGNHKEVDFYTLKKKN